MQLRRHSAFAESPPKLWFNDSRKYLFLRGTKSNCLLLKIVILSLQRKALLKLRASASFAFDLDFGE
jgi:hypothetical protein